MEIMAYDSTKRKAYYEANKEKIAAYDKAYREANKEKIKEYRKKNKEKIAAYSKEYRKKNKEKIAAKAKAYQQTKEYKKNRLVYIKQYRKKNKEKIAAQVSGHYYKNKKHKMSVYRQRKYGITPEDYDIMLKEQNYKCKICLIKFNNNYNKESKKDYAHAQQLDHCHTTNKIRGILCPFCNKGLGHFKDNTEILTNAIDYLKEAETLPEEFKQ
jgi:hypothetical protein